MASFFERMSDGQILKYLTYVRKVIEQGDYDLDFEYPGDFLNYTDRTKIGNKLFMPISTKYNVDDVEYLFMLLKDNEEGSENLKRPSLKNYTVVYTEKQRTITYNTYHSSFDSYLDDPGVDYVNVLQGDGLVDLYEDLIDTEYGDNDYLDGEIEDVYET